VKELKFDNRGLIPAIVQDADSGQVLMLGYMNQESVNLTLTKGDVWFYSRSRQELWNKGATSGNKLIVQEVCTGEVSCFFQRLSAEDAA